MNKNIYNQKKEVGKIEIEDLVKRAKEGDSKAYSELMEMFEEYLKNVARTKVKNVEDVKDIVQETFAIGYFKLYTLKDHKKFKSWITTILVKRCTKFNKKNAHRREIFDEHKSFNELYSEDNTNDKLNFDSLLKDLNEKEKQVFEMQYKDNLTSKEISKRLNMNENTVKSILKRGKDKLRKTIKPSTIFMIILCIITTSVVAASIIGYVMGLFETNSVGVDNDGILMAIEHMEWYQDVDMDYIELNDGYKMKVDYLLMDEMNLYMVVDLESENDISKYNEFSIADLKIVDENDEVICDMYYDLAEQYSKAEGSKIIEKTKNRMKILVYMYTDKFPNSKTLNISFSEISLAKKLDYIDIRTNENIEFTIDLAEKFINRKSVTYFSEDNDVEKAIITETGFYAIIQNNDRKLSNIELIDEKGNKYKCVFYTITDYGTKYIIIANINDVNNQILNLIVDNKEYNLEKEN